MQRGLKLLLLVIIAGGAYFLQFGGGENPETTPIGGEARLARAMEQQESGFMVRVSGAVERLLSDDTEGARHQRFILELATGQTILIAHNLDLATRVPLRKGDVVEVHGQFEYSERGGTIHWTHHDPGGRRAGGWIDHAGIRYR